MRGVAMRWMMAMAGVLAAVPAAAQSGCILAPAAAADSAAAEGGRAPDVIVRATVTAREVRFNSQPRTSVRALGCAALDSVVVTERVNLPDPVQPGVTYRDVRVGIEIRAHLGVACHAALAAADPALAQICTGTSADSSAAPPAPAPPTPPRR